MCVYIYIYIYIKYFWKFKKFYVLHTLLSSAFQSHNIWKKFICHTEIYREQETRDHKVNDV